MKTLSEPQNTKNAKAVQERPVGAGGRKLDPKQKKILNLEEESKHSVGKEKLAIDQATRDVDGSGK